MTTRLLVTPRLTVTRLSEDRELVYTPVYRIVAAGGVVNLTSDQAAELAACLTADLRRRP